MNWKRITAALSQEARQLQLDDELVPVVVKTIERLTEMTGGATASRPAVLRIGRVLLRSQLAPLIIAPCCPDYAHANDSYTFNGLGGGVSLLAQQHIAFLEGILDVLPAAHVLMLLADQEAEDPELCRRCDVSPERFRELIQASLAATQETVATHGWKAEMMTAMVPDFCCREAEIMARLATDATVRTRLNAETFERTSIYERINRSLTHHEKLARTIRTAAQYLLLADFARNSQALLCNHTTTNLAWYADAGAAVLHNPIVVY